MRIQHTLALTIVAALFTASTQPASAAVTGFNNFADFETTTLAQTAITQQIPGWTESTLVFNTFNDWRFHSHASFTNQTTVVGISNANGFIYQQIGTYRPGQVVIVGGEALRRNNGFFGELRVSLFSGNVAPATGSSLTSLGATLLDSHTFTATELGLTGSTGVAGTNFTIDLNQGALGVEGEALWVEFSNPIGNGRESFFDNVFAFAVPEPSTGLLLSFGLFGLCGRRRRRRG